MKIFIKSIDEKVWNAVVNEWKPPVTKDADGSEILKPEGTWTLDEDRIAIYNSMALNAIINGIGENEFKLISKC